jgi:hypothetical protein
VVDVTGTGGFDGYALQAKAAKVSNNGVGKVVVKVSSSLDATASGIATIEYVGSPRVRQNTSGLGKVVKRR